MQSAPCAVHANKFLTQIWNTKHNKNSSFTYLRKLAQYLFGSALQGGKAGSG